MSAIRVSIHSVGNGTCSLTGKESESDWLKKLGAKEVLLRKTLNLEKIKPLVDRSCAEMEAIHRESWHRVVENSRQMNQQIAAHLTTAQKTKLEQLEQERRELFRKKCGPRPNGESGPLPATGRPL